VSSAVTRVQLPVQNNTRISIFPVNCGADDFFLSDDFVFFLFSPQYSNTFPICLNSQIRNVQQVILGTTATIRFSLIIDRILVHKCYYNCSTSYPFVFHKRIPRNTYQSRMFCDFLANLSSNYDYAVSIWLVLLHHNMVPNYNY